MEGKDEIVKNGPKEQDCGNVLRQFQLQESYAENNVLVTEELSRRALRESSHADLERIMDPLANSSTNNSNSVNGNALPRRSAMLGIE